MPGDSAPGEASRRPPVEEHLRRRERAVGWALFGGLVLLVGLGVGVVLLALPLLVIAFPLTLSAVVVALTIGWWRHRSRR